VTSQPRVAFVVESGTDVRLVEGLAARCRLTVLARRIRGGSEISQPVRSQPDVVVGPASFARFAWFTLRWLLRHRRELDAILVQGYGPAALASNLAARAAGIPAAMLVCSPVEAYYRCRRADVSGSPYRWYEALAISVLARVNARIGIRYVVLSPYLASVVRRHGTTAPVDVIPVYGVDTRLFAPATDGRAGIRLRLGLPVDAVLLFFSSRIAPEKDPDTLLDAVTLLRREGQDVRIVHLSGGYGEFLARARTRGLETAVIARDAVPPFTRLAEWYQAADVCVQASREEGLGFSTLEALACEVPVVAADVGGLRDTIREPDTGWTYPPGSVDGLARALRSALEHPDESLRRARRGRVMVAGSFEAERTFDALAGVLASQCSPQPAAGVEGGTDAP
jgi:glycosyltransferase involved in cell wall biosynthesis